jgi:hypothetical protein
MPTWRNKTTFKKIIMQEIKPLKKSHDRTKLTKKTQKMKAK